MTALAGLALMENGVARDAPAISRAREVVVELARRLGSNLRPRAGDLVSREVPARAARRSRRAHSDAWGSRLAGGDQEGIWTYTVPRKAARARGHARADRGAASAARPHGGTFSSRGRGTTQIRSSHFWASGRRAGTDSTRISRWNRSITTFVRHSSEDGRWGYRLGMPGTDSMSCAGLMGLAIAASRPSLAERQTARRGERRWPPTPRSSPH